MKVDFSKFGVVDWGYTENSIPNSFDKYKSWVDKDLAGPLEYLKDHRKKLRKDIKNYYPEFQSALVFLFSYHKKRIGINNFLNKHSKYNGKKIASYALCFEGDDYHYILKKKLLEIAAVLQKQFEGLDYKLTLDVHPVLERDLAAKSGLGWFGKNSMLINRNHGSFTMIASILFNQKLEIHEKNQSLDHCGTCRACIDVCPTDAIIEDIRQIDAGKCISTYTIEVFKDEKPKMDYSGVKEEVFGCDLCQDVCPWNINLDKKLNYEKFEISEKLKSIIDYFLLRPDDEIISELSDSSNRSIQKKFKGSVFERTGRVGLLKNFKALKK